METLAFVPKVKVLLKATSNDDQPTPLHLMNDIKEICLESPVLSCQVADFLSHRLQKEAVHTKLKALKLMVYLVEGGREEFCQSLRNNSHILQVASNYSSEQDELRGFFPSKGIREEANKLQALLFDVENRQSSSGQKPPSEGKKFLALSGMGNTGGLQGFGNFSSSTGSSFKDTILSRVSDLSISKKSVIDVNMKPETAHLSLHTSSKPHLDVRKHVPGKAGGGWEDDTESERPYGSQLSSSPDLDVQTSRKELLIESDEEEAFVIATVYKQGYEYLFRNEINIFISKLHGFNCEKIIHIINKELKKTESELHGLNAFDSTRDISECTNRTQPYTIRLLQLLEHLIYVDGVNLDILITECLSTLQYLYSSTLKSIFYKVKKILLVLSQLTGRDDIIPLPTT